MSKRKFDSNKIVRLHCELCGKPSGKQLKLGEIADKIPDGDKLKGEYLHGMCDECAEHLKQGGVFFVDETKRCMKVSLTASKEKLDPAYHGKVIKLPVSCVDELVRVWALDKIKTAEPQIDPAADSNSE